MRATIPSSSRGGVFTSLEQMIGNTPCVKLHRFATDHAANVFLKLEHFNPGGSVKDRTALGMIRRAEEEGALGPGMRLVESSSGNTAIGLAMLGAERGYSVCAICDRHLPAAKKARLFAFGADILFLPQTPAGIDTVQLRIAVATWLADAVPNSISLGQYSNSANPQIHYETTGPEIWEAFDGQIDVLVAAVGTCGTISGVGRFLKERKPSVQAVGVEPEGSIIFGGENRPYVIQGGGLSFIPSILDRSVVDRGLKVADAESVAAVHGLARAEGLLVGGTGGLVVEALARLAPEFGPGRNLIGIIPDAGERYLDTLYDEQWLNHHHFRERLPPRGSVDGELAEGATAIGCSLNHIPDDPGPSIAELCQRVGASPSVVANLAENRL